jgi:hypothetical protein
MQGAEGLNCSLATAAAGKFAILHKRSALFSLVDVVDDDDDDSASKEGVRKMHLRICKMHCTHCNCLCQKSTRQLELDARNNQDQSVIDGLSGPTK